MSSYHFSMQVISRSAGRSVVAAAAYRSGQKLEDHRAGRIADFSRRRGVVYSEILAPAGSAPWLRDREVLWNAVEMMERRRDSQLAREINLALPHELSPESRLELVRGFVEKEFVGQGMVADIAIHQPVAEKGDDPRNHHAHILLTLRQATPQGLREVKTREWNSDTLLKHWREAWADHQNSLLRRAGQGGVDHRSLADQRYDALRVGNRAGAIELDRIPEVHLGPGATAALRKQKSLPREASPQLAVNRRPDPQSNVNPPMAGRRPFQSESRIAANIERHSINARRWSGSIVRLQLRAARARRVYHLRQARQGRGNRLPVTRYARSQGALQRIIAELEKLIRALIRQRDVRLVRRSTLRLPSRALRFGRSRRRSPPTLAELLPPW